MRTASVKRETKETQISIELNLDLPGEQLIETGQGFFDHLLSQLAFHGRLSLKVQAKGDQQIDDHHLIEDTGITLGMALRQALGERQGLVRYHSLQLPMDEVLVGCALDLTTRPYLVYGLTPAQQWLGQFDTALAREFWVALVNATGCNLHLQQLANGNAHHLLEGSFKAFAVCLQRASRPDPTLAGGASSTKGLL